jgi:hypothetical protein
VAAGLKYDRKDLEVISAMRDFSSIMHGKSAARIDDDDPSARSESILHGNRLDGSCVDGDLRHGMRLRRPMRPRGRSEQACSV